MNYANFFLSLLFVSILVFSCKQEEGSSYDEIFTETVENHTKQYCECSQDLQKFVNEVYGIGDMDSATFILYKMKQAEFNQCFNTRQKQLFRDSLTPEYKLKQDSLFQFFKEKYCPSIIPNK